MTQQTPSVTRTLRTAVKIGDDYYTIEETISLPPDASDDEIEQAVDTGRRMYQVQRAAVETQIRELRDQVVAQVVPAQIREPDAPASEKQRAYMDYLLNKLGWDNERLQEFAAERQLNLLTLTKREASELIDDLRQVLAGGTEQSQAAADRIEQDAERNIGFAPPIDPDDDPLFSEEPTQRQIPIAERATQRQIRALERLIDERGIDVAAEIGDRQLDDLSTDEAGQLLSAWQQRPRVVRPAARRT